MSDNNRVNLIERLCRAHTNVLAASRDVSTYKIDEVLNAVNRLAKMVGTDETKSSQAPTVGDSSASDTPF